MPSFEPPFFRFSFIANVQGYLRGRKVKKTVHGLYFRFHAFDRRRDDLVRGEVIEMATDYAAELGNSEVSTGEEEVAVTKDEAKGIGFYYAHFLVNDRFHHKIDLRFR